MLPETLIASLSAFVGGNEKALALITRLFRSIPSLALADDTVDAQDVSPHTGTAHNADAEKYLPVRDARCPDVPLVVKPVNGALKRGAKASLLCFVVAPDNAKFAKHSHCRQFAESYMGKTLRGKKTFEALNASVFARQAGEDIRNNAAGREQRKASKMDALVKAAQPFLMLDETAWGTIAPSIEDRDEDLHAVIVELRAENIPASPASPENA